MKCQSHRHAASVIIFDKIGRSIDRVHNKCITFTNCFAVFSFLTDLTWCIPGTILALAVALPLAEGVLTMMAELLG